MPDLVIGARRQTGPRPFRAVAIALLVVAVGSVVAYVVYRRVVSYAHPGGAVPDATLVADADPRSAGPPRLVFGDSHLGHAGGLSVLRLVGDPHTLGAAHGRLLAGAVAEAEGMLAPTINASIDDDGWLSGLTAGMRLRWRYRFLDDGVPGHQLVELAGLVRGVSASAAPSGGYDRLLRQHAALDVGVPAPWSAGSELRAISRSLTVVAPARGVSGERLLVGRSFALPGAGDGGEAAARRTVVSFVHPEGEVIPYASVGWPGQIGVVSGINAEGIAVMVHPVRTADVEAARAAQPMTLLARDILEHARTLEDAIGILEQARPLGAAAFVVVDGAARKWAIVERSPKKVQVIRDPPQAAITDLLDGEPFVDDLENDRARRTRPSLMRQRRAAALLKPPPAAPEDLATLLRDHRNVEGRALPLGHRGAVVDIEAVHAAIFDASAMVLWVADGPGALGRFRAFDLRYELRGEGARAAPPADLPAAEAEASAALELIAARRDLREARRAWLADERRRAHELVQRALARAPELPEALELAGQLARASNRRDEARAYYQRYLDAGADNLATEEAVRALLAQP